MGLDSAIAFTRHVIDITEGVQPCKAYHKVPAPDFDYCPSWKVPADDQITQSDEPLRKSVQIIFIDNTHDVGKTHDTSACRSTQGIQKERLTRYPSAAA